MLLHGIPDRFNREYPDAAGGRPAVPDPRHERHYDLTAIQGFWFSTATVDAGAGRFYDFIGSVKVHASSDSISELAAVWAVEY